MPVEIGNVPAVDAIANLRSKLAIPTTAWDDHLALPRAKAFVVAGATKVALLNDLQEDIASALEQGESISQFRKRVDQTVQTHGWTYNGKRGWRTRVIYDNNLRSAQMAGRWAQIQRVKKQRPYLVYKTVGDTRVRDQHREWHDIVLPVDDPWWDTHYPPNGWGCRCYITSANDRLLERMGLEPNKRAPDLNKTERINPTTGEVYGDVPQGIDVGWDNNVGKQWLAPDAAFGEQLMQLPRDVRRAATANDGKQFEQLRGSFSVFAKRALDERSQNKMHSVGWLQDQVIEALAKRDIVPKTATIMVSDARLKRMRRDKKQQKDIDLPTALLQNLPEELKRARAVLIDK